MLTTYVRTCFKHILLMLLIRFVCLIHSFIITINFIEKRVKNKTDNLQWSRKKRIIVVGGGGCKTGPLLVCVQWELY